ncbi:MAG: STAS domain-containing protein [Clostridia bacterium]|nr:STAS domain-containing protein [Clostridia bacterium]
MIRTTCKVEFQMRETPLTARLIGEIDHHAAARIREEIDKEICHRRPTRMVLDLSGIEFMDSAGLGLLMGRYRLMRELGGVMVLSAPNPRVMKILRLSGMERFFEIEDVPKGERL